MIDEVQKHLLKQARIHLINVQAQHPATSEIWRELNELIAGIEKLLGFT